MTESIPDGSTPILEELLQERQLTWSHLGATGSAESDGLTKEGTLT